jgi:toxin YhaV
VSGAPLIVNGWEIYAHPLVLDQLEAMIGGVEAARARDPSGYSGSRAAKLLAATLKVAFEAIPGDPTREDYRQGATLGADNKHWFRAKYLQQYRLFFRYRQSGAGKVIVLAWVNDDNSLRAYGSKTDAYATFAKMLKRGNPPDNWETLFAASSASAATSRLKRVRP